MKKRDYAGGSQKMAGNEQIAAEVGQNPAGIGYVGMAYVKAGGVKVVPDRRRDPFDPKCPEPFLSLLASDLLLHQW